LTVRPWAKEAVVATKINAKVERKFLIIRRS